MLKILRVLDFFHRNAIVDFEAAHDVDEHVLRGKAVHGEERFRDGVFDFVGREGFPLAVAFDDVQLIHYWLRFWLLIKTAQGEIA